MTRTNVNGASRLFPIIGDPVRWVESPRRLTTTLTERGHDALCVPIEVTAADLDTVMAGLTASRNVDGLLVTMPHKGTAFAHCATASDAARRLGVVSIIRRNADGTWHGDMLDGIAFVKAQVEHGATVAGARALLIGAGGAGSAIAIALLQAGVGRLVIHDTDADRVGSFLAGIADLAAGRASAGPNDPTGFDLVLNATPLGMNEGDPLPVDPGQLSDAMFCGDVISGHGLTPFLAAAEAAGCATANGSHMVEAAQHLMVDFLVGPRGQ